MKQYGWILAALLGASALWAAPENSRPTPADDPAASGNAARHRHFRMSPEEQQAMRKRRFEIMVLLHSYRLMPEQERAAIKAELEKRVAADFAAELAYRKNRLAAFEAGLAKRKKEIGEQEKNMGQAVAAEVERLLKMPLPPPPVPGGDHPSGHPETPMYPGCKTPEKLPQSAEKTAVPAPCK